MKRYRVNMLIPSSKEILVADEQEARREAKRLTNTDGLADSKNMQAILHSLEFVRDEPDPIDFGFTDEVE